jgi:hypothetical protein
MRVKLLSHNNTKKSIPKSAGKYALTDVLPEAATLPETPTLIDDNGC